VERPYLDKEMLKQVLHEIETAQGPITVCELSRKFAVEPDAIEGMIQFLVRKGILQDDDPAAKCQTDSGACSTSSCGASACVFIAKMPKTYSIPVKAINLKPYRKP
jgi:predicted transcriptional regulator